MKKIITMIGIACAFCCVMLLNSCKANDVPNFSEGITYYTISYDDVISADIEDSYWDYDYDTYYVNEYPSEENDGMLKYTTYDSNGDILTINSVNYDWAISYYFG